MKTPEEYSQDIDIANRELTYADSSDDKVKWQNRIKKLKLQREIAIIQKKIDQLNNL